MGKYIIKRICLAILTIWVVATITFLLMNLVPGGPFLSDKAISPEAKAALEAKYGLDKSLGEQYVTYMIDAFHGDFGESLNQRGRTVMDIISSKFPVSAGVGIRALIVSICVGVPLGVIAAHKRGSFWDRFLSVIATCGIAVPGFVFCIVLLYSFGVKWRILPTYGLSEWKSYIMPVMALSIYPISHIMSLMRSSMLDIIGQDYMRTAKAKGVNQKVCLFKHALRNAVLPVITYVGPMIAYILVGSFVVERIFAIPGLGGEFIKAVNGRDYMMIMGTTIFLATLVVIMNVIIDIVYKIVDPRIKLQ